MAGVKQNVIFEFVKEVQVKTSGFEAEYGGAIGRRGERRSKAWRQ